VDAPLDRRVSFAANTSGGHMPDLLHPADAAPEQDPAAPPDDPGEFGVAGYASDSIQADLLVDALEDAGIDAFLDGDRAGMVEKLSSPAEGYPIRVPLKSLEAAGKLIAERKAALEADPEAAGRAADEAQLAEEAEAGQKS
jgi:hypothetical protein